MFKRTLPRLVPVQAFLTIALMLALAIGLAGCDSDPATPDPNDNAAAPALPDPARLVPDLAFFDHGEVLVAKGASGDATAQAASKSNFINAYVRVVVVNALTRLVLTPPVAAFAVALHTIPSLQPDGSWLWVYTYVNGAEEAQIRLRGQVVADRVDWELRVSSNAHEPPFENVLWFEGSTRRNGDEGHWIFHDPEIAGNPAVGELTWGDDASGEYLTLACVHGTDAGDSLTYRHAAPDCAIIFRDGATSQDWDIRWNEQDGTGSLMVPDYNGGQRACWDERQDDVVCPQ
jgi:hypothetical protein